MSDAPQTPPTDAQADAQAEARAAEAQAAAQTDAQADAQPHAQADGAEAAPPSVDAGNLSPDAANLSPDAVKLALRKVRDPEINLNIVDLGLIYDIQVDDGDVRVDMSLTSPGCPSGPEIMTEAENEVKAVSGVNNVVINLVWSPPWSPERIDPRVRTYLGM